MTKLLVVDDEKNIRRLYESELKQEGYEVDTAESAEDALKLIAKSPPDLVILDIRLDGMDGIDCLRTIMEKRRDLPVILNSAYSTYKQDFASWMADAYVVKSADLTELKQKVREVLAKRGRA
ncbi:MAG: response regulator [Candidatus Eisenbacteria bacterium]|nr:response regulator [Candidatus Eisenbacteria bacterium]